jgi:hypothetical protein
MHPNPTSCTVSFSYSVTVSRVNRKPHTHPHDYRLTTPQRMLYIHTHPTTSTGDFSSEPTELWRSKNLAFAARGDEDMPDVPCSCCCSFCQNKNADMPDMPGNTARFLWKKTPLTRGAKLCVRTSEHARPGDLSAFLPKNSTSSYVSERVPRSRRPWDF